MIGFVLCKDFALAYDLPEEQLLRGDIVTLVDHHVSPDDQEGCSADVFNAGDTLVIITVPSPTPSHSMKTQRTASKRSAEIQIKRKTCAPGAMPGIVGGASISDLAGGLVFDPQSLRASVQEYLPRQTFHG